MKEIKDFEGYRVTSDGEVYSFKRSPRGVALKKQKNIDGYNVVNLFKDGKYFHRRVARLVAEAFLESPKESEGIVVNHMDHTRTNDHVDNLEWCTIQENTQQSTQKHPERWLHKAKITESDVRLICEMIEKGMRNVEISRELGNIPPYGVGKIRSGRTWSWISSEYNMVQRKGAVSEETVRWICRKILEGWSSKDIFSKCTSEGITINIVKNIKARKSWRYISKQYF